MEQNIAEMNLNKDHLYVVHNDLIKGRSNLSINELKLLRIAIKQIVKEDTDFKTYQVSIREFAQLLRIDESNLYQEAFKICEHLMKEIVYVGDGNPKHKWKLFHWVSCCSYENGTITIKLHEELKPYLINLSALYSQIPLCEILELKSVYSIRIWELIREAMRGQQAYGDREVVVSLSVDTIRKATNTENKMKQMGHFKDKVIDKAVNEINQKLPYSLTYTFEKNSRKIVGFRFTIKRNYENILTSYYQELED